MAKDKYENLSPQGREAIERGDNPRSLSDEDYAAYVEAHDGSDPTLSPVASNDDEAEGGEDE